MKVDHVYEGDCIAGLANLPAGSVDLAFADPPFNIGYEYDAYDDSREHEQYLDWSRRWGEAVVRVLRPAGSFWLAIGDEYAAELKVLFQNLGLTCRSWVIWYYTFGVNCTRKFSRSHAHLFHFVRDPEQFTFNADAIRVPSARQLVYADARANATGRLPDDTWILRPQDLPEGFTAGEDTWYFSRVCGTFKQRAGWHGCQMPEQLLGRIIRVSSNAGDVVLDPFAGSGTTLAVAKKLGRRWLGFELSANYCARIRARLEQISPGQALEGAEEPRVSAPRTPTRDAVVAAPRTEPAEIRRGIIEAFFTVRDGYSADRVIADPELNGHFARMCRRLGLPGDVADWNRRLLNLRRAGCFLGLPRARKSCLSRADIDRYGFACEIALQQFANEGMTAEQVLCAPDLAKRFDDLVRSMLPEKAPTRTLRLIALHWRKQAKRIREAGNTLAHWHPLPDRSEPADGLDFRSVPAGPGLYWLEGPERKLYVGETLDLRARLNRQLNGNGFEFWDTPHERIGVRYAVMPDDDRLLKGNQSRWIAAWRPIGNYAAFAV